MESRLHELLEAALNDSENEGAKDAYIDALSLELKEASDITEVITCAIKGVSLDHATCIRDIIESEKDGAERRTEIFRAIKNNDFLKTGNRSRNGFRFLCVMLASSIGCKRVWDNLLPFIISCLVPNNWEGEVYCTDSQKEDFAIYFLPEIPAKTAFPEWREMKIKAETADKLIAWISALLMNESDGDDQDINSVPMRLRRWIRIGKPYIQEKLDKEKWEASRPERKADELAALAEHYKKTDEVLDQLHEENRKLLKEKEDLQEQGDEQQKTIGSLKGEIVSLQKDLESADQSVADLQEKLQESQNLVISLETFRTEEKTALMQDIANALRVNYKDFMESVNDEMDVELGEIYRDILKSIFRILEGKGIKL